VKVRESFRGNQVDRSMHAAKMFRIAQISRSRKVRNQSQHRSHPPLCVSSSGISAVQLVKLFQRLHRQELCRQLLQYFCHPLGFIPLKPAPCATAAMAGGQIMRPRSAGSHSSPAICGINSWCSRRAFHTASQQALTRYRPLVVRRVSPTSKKLACVFGSFR